MPQAASTCAVVAVHEKHDTRRQCCFGIFGMGCAPSVVDETATTRKKTRPTSDPDGSVPADGSEARERTASTKSTTTTKASKCKCDDSSEANKAAGKVCEKIIMCKNKQRNEKCCSDKVSCSSDDVHFSVPMGTAVDEDSEGESASLLCANLRRNFMVTSSRSSSRNISSARRRNGSSTGGGSTATITQAPPLATTAEEQNESYLIGTETDGDSNPLLRRKTVNGEGGSVEVTSCAKSNSDLVQNSHNQASTGPAAGQTTVPHYMQLQLQQQQFPFHCGRKLSNHVIEKVRKWGILRDVRVYWEG